MTTAAAQHLSEALDYVHRRIAVYLGTLDTRFAAFIQAGSKAEGWVRGEALFALTRSLVADKVNAVKPGGRSEGRPDLEPDFEFQIGGQPHFLNLVSVAVSGARPLASYFASSGELPRDLRKLAGRPQQTSLIVVSYPLRMDDKPWTEEVGKAEQTYGVKCVQQLQFQLPGPDRVVVSLWRHASATPA
ncbi:MAG: hypothetical protein HY686_05440 [Chloroflexi bacterium]|nr:hypothetical protein [Chloroflexota bacterium]